MTRLTERGLFFGAGLLFGAALGFLASRTPEPSRAPPGVGAAAEPEARPLDPGRMEALLAEVEARPEDPAARARVGDLHLEARAFRDAVYWLQQARNLDPADPDIRSRLAFALFGLGEVSGAAREYEAALAADSEHFPSLLGLGRLRLYAEQDLAAGLALWERAIAAAPDSPGAAALRAEIEALRSAHPE